MKRGVLFILLIISLLVVGCSKENLTGELSKDIETEESSTEKIINENVKELAGDWKIKGHVGSFDDVIFEGDINLNEDKFSIVGERLIDLPYDKTFAPHSFNQEGVFGIIGTSIIFTLDVPLNNKWAFYGEYKLLKFDNKEEFQKGIDDLPEGLYYISLERASPQMFALFLGPSPPESSPEVNDNYYGNDVEGHEE